MCQDRGAPAVTVCASAGKAGNTLLFHGHRRRASLDADKEPNPPAGGAVRLDQASRGPQGSEMAEERASDEYSVIGT